MRPSISIPQALAFMLGCALVLQSASPVLAQSAAAGANADPQPTISSTPTAMSSPADQASGSTGGATPEASPYPDAPAPETPDVKELLRVQQTNEAAKTQNPNSEALLQPQGAAAARVQPTTGTAASQPAGAAFAPARQRRSHSFLIRMGVLAGATIAVGSVVALSSGSPSKPPGSK
jgi:hypothetical protein